MEQSLERTMAVLERTPAALDAMLRGLPEEWARANEGEGEVPPAPPQAPTPLVREYWASQAKHRIGEIVSSHRVKYPYSFYALAKDVKDEDLKKRILAKVYRLTATN